jgi:hypothetical protein
MNMPLAFAWLAAMPLAGAGDARAEEPLPQVAFLTPSPGGQAVGPEAAAAFELAKELASATRIRVTAVGQFVDDSGRPAPLDRFAVLWYHEGDSAEPAGAMHEKVVAALREHVAAGRGLFLSGAALQQVYALGVEPAVPRVGAAGHDRYLASLVPVDRQHPLFRELSVQGQAVPLSDAGYPAFADFHGTAGPRGGMLLARAPAGAENPLVEYDLGKGRIIALGWRLPHYANLGNSHRRNLRQLTRNILEYLATPKQWQPIVIRPPQEIVAARREPGVPAEQWRALRSAIEDLAAAYRDRYPRGPKYLARLDALKQAHDKLLLDGRPPQEDAALRSLAKIADQFTALQRDALLANPLLDFDRLLVVKRRESQMGLPMNWQGNSCLPKTGYDNEIALLSPVQPGGKLSPLFRPEGGRFVGDLELHFDADRLLCPCPARMGAGKWPNWASTAHSAASCRSCPIPPSITTTPVTCPTAISCSARRLPWWVCRASPARRTSPTCFGSTRAAARSASSRSSRTTTGARPC